MSDGLPRGWVETSLGTVLVDVVGGGTPSRNVPAYYTGKIPWFTVKDLKSLRPDDAQEHITQEAVENSATNVVAANTLVIATRIALGKAVKPRVACAINQDLKALILHRGMNTDFMLYWFFSNELAIQEMGSGTTVLGIRLEQLRSLSLRLPPAAEQTRIVEKLEELLGGLDAGVAELQAAQRKLALYRQSLLKAAVEGALTQAWRAARASPLPNPSPTRGEGLNAEACSAPLSPCGRGAGGEGEPAAELLQRILHERRARWEDKQRARFATQGKPPPAGWQAKYPEPVAPDTTHLPELPEGWVWASVEQLAELVSGHTPKDASLYSSDTGTVQWFKVGDMNAEGNEESLFTAATRFTEESTSQLGLKIAPAGTIVFPKRGGAIATNKKRRLGVAGAYDLNMMGLVAIPTAAEWLWSWFKGIDLAKLSDGSNVPQINNPDIAPLPVPLPPLAEQHAIINHLDTALTACNAQQAAIAHGLQQAAAQRRNLLKAAFAGQLVPQDPSDEPASALLERIRTTRVQTPAPRGRRRKEAG
ncbi:MAG: restriction endonuclease subunit S [Xanthomonadaceae bacterium]|nr:restriction endonuclease subunit S [Xanthomonadaceae bacterium]